jgi:hypothetical protein
VLHARQTPAARSEVNDGTSKAVRQERTKKDPAISSGLEIHRV